MTDESVSATTVFDASAEAIFAVLSDPATHAGSTAPGGSANRSTASR